MMHFGGDKVFDSHLKLVFVLPMVTSVPKRGESG